jgi:hypothetical protein
MNSNRQLRRCRARRATALSPPARVSVALPLLRGTVRQLRHENRARSPLACPQERRAAHLPHGGTLIVGRGFSHDAKLIAGQRLRGSAHFPRARVRPGRAGFQPRRKDGAQRLHFAAKFPRAFDFALAFDSASAFSVFSRSGLGRSNRNTTAFKIRRNPLQTQHITFSNRNNNPCVAIRVAADPAPHFPQPAKPSAHPIGAIFKKTGEIR